MYKYICFFLCIGMSGIVIAQEKVELYPGGVINQKAGVELDENVTEFYSYKPAKVSSDIAFLIIPGGGYSKVAIQHEGHDVAKKLQDLGFVSFVLRYRLPKSEQQQDKRIAPIQDAQ